MIACCKLDSDRRSTTQSMLPNRSAGSAIIKCMTRDDVMMMMVY